MLTWVAVAIYECMVVVVVVMTMMIAVWGWCIYVIRDGDGDGGVVVSSGLVSGDGAGWRSVT